MTVRCEKIDTRMAIKFGIKEIQFPEWTCNQFPKRRWNNCFIEAQVTGTNSTDLEKHSWKAGPGLFDMSFPVGISCPTHSSTFGP